MEDIEYDCIARLVILEKTSLTNYTHVYNNVMYFAEWVRDIALRDCGADITSVPHKGNSCIYTMYTDIQTFKF